MVDQLIGAVLKVRYPRELLEIQVLDDSTDDTHPYTEALVARLKAQGQPIEYIHRANRNGYKAGALQEGMARAKGEFLALFDADFIPPEDFLEKAIDFFADPKVGVVQTRWTYMNRDHSLLTEVQALMLDGHFALEHVARSGQGLYFNFNGTAGILRRTMIEDAGGWQHDTLTEDSDLSYRAQMKGWRFVYLPWIECPSELPVDTYGFQVQQQRWAKGLTQCALKLLPQIFRSKQIPLREKIEAWFHMTPNISYPLMVIVSAMMLPVMIVRFYIGWLDMLLVDAPLIVCSFWSVVTFYLLAEHELYPENVEAGGADSAVPAGDGRGADYLQHERRDRGPAAQAVGFCAHAKVRPAGRGRAARSGLPPQERLAALRRDRHGHWFSGHRLLLYRRDEFPGAAVPADLRVRLLLGRFQHAVAGTEGPLALRA